MGEENNLSEPSGVEEAREAMLTLLKKVLASESFIGKEEMSRYLLQ